MKDDLTLDVDMEIKYQGETISELTQENWWVCSFTPDIQFVKIDDLDVTVKARFTDESLRQPFYDAYLDNIQENNPWKNIIFILMPPYTTANKNQYQFKLEY